MKPIPPPSLPTGIKSNVEQRLHQQMRGLCLPCAKTGHEFAPPRDWSFDFAWPDIRLAVEVEGHTSHQTTRFESDCVKYGEAVLKGWRLLRVTSKMVNDGRAVRLIQRAIRRFSAESDEPNIGKSLDLVPAKFAVKFTPEDEREINQMPTPTAAPERPMCPPGIHILTLKAIKEVELDSKYSDSGKTIKWVWEFETKQTDDKTGEPFEFSHWTTSVFNKPKDTMLGKLPNFYAAILPKLSKEERAEFDADELIGSRFKAIIKHVEGNNGNLYANIIDIEPFVPKKATPTTTPPPVPIPSAPDEEDESDPFDEGEEE